MAEEEVKETLSKKNEDKRILKERNERMKESRQN